MITEILGISGTLLNVVYRFPNYFGASRNTLTCVYIASNTSTLLVISVIMIFALKLQDTGHVSHSVESFLTIYLTLISPEEVPFFK